MKNQTLLLVILILGSGCVSQAPVYTDDPMAAKARHLQDHPLTPMTTEEADAFLPGHFWNGDRLLNRNLDLKDDMTFHYTQEGPINRPAIMHGVVASSQPDRYPHLSKNFDWELKGTWSLIRNKGFYIRLDITESRLLDTAESLPTDAFLQLAIMPDKGYKPLGIPLVQEAAPEAAPKRADGIMEIKLSPTDHSPKPYISSSPFDTHRWPFPMRTFMGRNLIRQ